MRRFTLVELLTVVAILMVLAAIAIPNLYDMQMRAREAEIRPNGSSLLDALIAYQAATDNDVIHMESAPSGTAGKQKRPFAATGLLNWVGWEPDGDLYGSYTAPTIGASTIALCNQSGESGLNAQAVVPGSRPLHVTMRQDLNGTNGPVDWICCETKPGLNYPAEVQGRCAKHTNFLFFPDW